MTLVTHQTGPAGRLVKRLYIEDGSAIERELYLSALVDRATSRIAFIVSTEGGMDIEEVAHKTPEKIHTFQIGPAAGYSPYVGNEIAVALGLKGDAAKQIGKVVKALYEAFLAKDMSLLEINPLVATKSGQIICLDAKIGFDDNALFRQADIVALRDINEEDGVEQANTISLTLSWTVKSPHGNGAGLATATMDIIKLNGASAAIGRGGGATKEKGHPGLQDHCQRSHVKGILVNIFGGIMKCDIIAEGTSPPPRKFPSVPLVVRLEGTSRGSKEFWASGHITSAANLADAAERL
jgi:succinyl-CoA synthetase beta subunit